MNVRLPELLAINQSEGGGWIRQFAFRQSSADFACATYKAGHLAGYLLQNAGGEEILVLSKKAKAPAKFKRVLLWPGVIDCGQASLDLSSAVWLAHPSRLGNLDVPELRNLQQRVLASWRENLFFPSSPHPDKKTLRLPQLGALHAIQAHWSVSSQPATVVMPTGTGKTETMLATMVSVPCERILVVVPTDALRQQLADKFLTLGLLKDPEYVDFREGQLFPVVGLLDHKPKSIEDVNRLFEACNVVITTSNIAGQSPLSIQRQIAHHCPYLFIDEAHHAEAPTWRAFKRQFERRRVLQFTATPFREDGQLVDGKIIYKFPLRMPRNRAISSRSNSDRSESFAARERTRPSPLKRSSS